MKDTLITLLEEPDKFKKIIFNLLEIILFSIITSVAYTNFFGPYELLLPTDPNFLSELYTFIISGRIVLIVFLYLFTKYTTILMLIVFPLGLLGFISKKFKRKLNKNKVIFMTSIIGNSMKIIFLNLKTQEVRLGPNFKEYYQRLQSYTKRKIEKELSDWKNSFISEVFILYSLFVYVYFFVLQIETPWMLDITIVAVLIFTICIFTLVHICVSFIGNHKKEILEFFTLVKQVHHTKTFIVDHKVQIKHQEQKTSRQEMTLGINHNKYYVYNLSASLHVTISYIESKIKTHQDGNIIIISPQIITKEVEKCIDSKPQVSHIQFISKKKLYKKLAKVFKNTTVQRIESR